jgi:ectoine hydroxylase-related dioxygenase (phytanoyl-CoA dioxygenase family)
MSATAARVLSDEQIEQYHRDGFFIARGLLDKAEAAHLLNHFMALHGQALNGDGPLAQNYQPKSLAECNGDILQHYPRIMMPHRHDEISRNYMLDARSEAVLADLFGEEPFAAQSMFYFKPPGARGQALHQDNFYLKVHPGNCMAAWFALDAADEENGGLFVVPGSHQLGVLCPGIADPKTSFTVENVEVPGGMEPVPVNLAAGDVLFFNGSVIHGSYPNTSTDRFRRAFICHYAPASTTLMAKSYDMLSFRGEVGHFEAAQGGGICGSEDWERLSRARQSWDQLSAAT